LGVLPFIIGCGSQKSGSATLEGQLKEMNLARDPTVQFAGTVTIDGKPPRDVIKDGLFIMLYNPQKPPAEKAAPLKAIVNRETGHFSFTTYAQGDGVPVGTYVVLFVALRHTVLGKDPGFHEPDALLNRYNDPDKNGESTDLKITVAAPGKSDYQFDLKLDGQEAVAAPGAHAVTAFVM
jgi:hypothetical protein